MNINHDVLKQVQAAGAKLVVVTKYENKAETEALISQLKAHPCVLGWGENRTTALEAKQLPRTQTHFIGRLQSRQLPTIVEHCGTIHSLASLKHAAKLNKIIEQKKQSPLQVFVQVNVGSDPAKEGIKPDEVPAFLKALYAFKGLKVLGLSAMGWGEFEVAAKRQEFRDLLGLRDEHLPAGQTSAGTSRDYKLALEEGIEVVRVGQAITELEDD